MDNLIRVSVEGIDDDWNKFNTIWIIPEENYSDFTYLMENIRGYTCHIEDQHERYITAPKSTEYGWYISYQNGNVLYLRSECDMYKTLYLEDEFVKKFDKVHSYGSYGVKQRMKFNVGNVLVHNKTGEEAAIVSQPSDALIVIRKRAGETNDMGLPLYNVTVCANSVLEDYSLKECAFGRGGVCDNNISDSKLMFGVDTCLHCQIRKKQKEVS